jgi:hypothetical protein
MGETAADTRHEIERTRSELGETLSALRSRTVVVRGKVIRVATIAAGAAGATGATVVLVMLVRRRRGGSITRAARRLPKMTQGAAIPAARAPDRWMSRRVERAREQREQLIEAISLRIAANQAEAERRANPLWRRTASKALETAATAGVAALIRRSLSHPIQRGSKGLGPLSPGTKELTGSKDVIAVPRPSTADPEASPAR